MAFQKPRGCQRTGGCSAGGSPAWGVATSRDSEPEARELEERLTRLGAKIEQRMDAFQVMLQTMLWGGKAPRPELQVKKESGNASSSEGTNSRSCAEPRQEVAQTAPVPSVRKRGPATMASSQGAKRALSGGTEPEGSRGRAVPGSSSAGSRSQEPEERLDRLESDFQQQTTAVLGMRQAWRGGPRAPAGAAAEGGVETTLAEVDRLHSEIQGRAPSRDNPEALVKWSWLVEMAGDAGDQGKQERKPRYQPQRTTMRRRRRRGARTDDGGSRLEMPSRLQGLATGVEARGIGWCSAPRGRGFWQAAQRPEAGDSRLQETPTDTGRRQQLVERRAAEPAGS
ncbi:uncharacterized protein PHA67_018235 [Liasis olivaceus]